MSQQNQGRTKRGRFVHRSKVSFRLLVCNMNSDETNKYKTALRIFLSELVRQHLGRRE